MLKNVAGQKVLLFAYNDTTGLPVIADEANITCEVSVNGAQFALAVNRATLTRVLNAAGNGTGFYSLTLDISETNGDVIAVIGSSATSGVVVQGASFYTQMQVSDKTGYSIAGTKQTLDDLNDIPAGSTMTLTPAYELTLVAAIDAAIETSDDTTALVNIKKILEADTKILTVSGKLVLVYYEKGTTTEIMRKAIKDLDGNPVTAAGTVVGQHVHTT